MSVDWMGPRALSSRLLQLLGLSTVPNSAGLTFSYLNDAFRGGTSIRSISFDVIGLCFPLFFIGASTVKTLLTPKGLYNLDTPQKGEVNREGVLLERGFINHMTRI